MIIRLPINIHYEILNGERGKSTWPLGRESASWPTEWIINGTKWNTWRRSTFPKPSKKATIVNSCWNETETVFCVHKARPESSTKKTPENGKRRKSGNRQFWRRHRHAHSRMKIISNAASTRYVFFFYFWKFKMDYSRNVFVLESAIIISRNKIERLKISFEIIGTDGYMEIHGRLVISENIQIYWIKQRFFRLSWATKC